MRRVLGDVGPVARVIVGLDLASMACDAAAIHAFMQPEARMVSYVRVLAAQASGRAINVLTPGGALGEATKVAMLVASAPRAHRVVDRALNLVTLYLSVVILFIGVPLTALLVDLPPSVAIVAWIGLAVGSCARDRARGADPARRPRRRCSPARGASAPSRPRACGVDRATRRPRPPPPRPAKPGRRNARRRSSVASRLCSWTATTTVLIAVGAPISATLLVGVFSVGILIGWVSSIVPLGVGIADGGNYALFGVLGATGAHGVFVTLLGRARSLIVALIGLAVMAAAHTATDSMYVAAIA